MKDLSNRHLLIMIVSMMLILMQCSGGNSKIGDIYTAEKMFFKAGQIERNILINPEIANPDEYQKAEKIYRDIIDKFNTTSQEIPEIKGIVRTSWLAIANLRLLQKKFDKAIDAYKEIIARSGADRDLSAIAQYSISVSLEKVQRIDEAIDAYQRLVQDYPPVQSDTLLPNFTILQTPIYIARLYQQQQKSASSEQQYDRARRYYEDVIAKWPNTQVAIAAQNQIAVSYGDQQQWEKSAEVLNDIIFTYSDKHELIDVMYRLAKLNEQQLNQPNRAQEIYKRILEKYPQNKDLGKVYLAIGGVFLAQKSYDQAREKFKYVLNNYGSDGNSCLQAQMSIAKTYELENNWSKAVNEYQWVVENFPQSLPALDIPLYIASYYEKQQELDLARIAFEKAIKQYKDTIAQYPNTMLASVASENIVEIYIKLEQWNEAVDALGLLTKMDLPAPNKIKAYLTLENIYEEKLNDAQKALEIYSELLQKYPQLPFASSIDLKSQELQQRLSNYQQSNTAPIMSEITAANMLSPSQVKIQWQQNNENDFYQYKLLRSETPGVNLSKMTIAEISSRQQVEYIDDNLKEGNTYYYRLFTFDKGGQTIGSREVAVTMEKKKISATLNLQARTIDWSIVALNWNSYPEQDFDSYKIYRSSAAGVTIASQLVKSIFDQATTQFEDKDLKENTSYYYRVYVFNSGGANQPSNEVSARTATNAPPKSITLNKPLTIDNNTVELSWFPSNENDFSMYRIYRSEHSPVSLNSPPIWINSNQTINRYKDQSLKSGRTYHYKIVVYDNGGLFAESNEVSISF